MVRPILLAALGAALPPAAAAVSEPAGLAAALRASAGESPAFVLTAAGAQVYECRVAPGTATGFAWTFVNPDATLSDASGSVARHSTPTVYESTRDRSSLSAQVRATQPAGADNLPWTIMRAQPSGDTGLFAGVTSVQRVNTRGGVAPRDGCGEGSVGTSTRMDFTADYYFYRRRTS